ncbi:MAG: hypothetical protein NTV81_04845, partial [Candidatus Komeilibacteria bacterium]|nr:hypothetical protein [Candidatus Komeilibacteria bacterium]
KEVIGKKIVKQFSEAHPMRFFTYNEIDLAIRNQSLALVKMYKIDQLKEEIDETSWNMSVIIKKV